MDFMFSRQVRSLGASLILLTFSFPSTAKVSHAASLDSDYVSALAAADRFLHAWQSGDGENGIALLTERAKKGMNPDGLDKFFSASGPSGYEINRGKRVRRGRYEFPVVLVSRVSNKLHREFSSIVIVNTSNNEWAVDKLP
ncbi:MAG: hypothetical protein WBD59_03395 [Candidatus Sulfotelmatobacter sp.]